jgi:hypothetical protein
VLSYCAFLELICFSARLAQQAMSFFRMQNLASELNSDQVVMCKFDAQAVLALADPDILNLAQEYYRLRVLPTLGEQQADCLGEIVAQAARDRRLDFWLTEIEHSLGHRLELLTAARRHVYEDQRSLLREHLGSQAIGQLCPVAAPVLPTHRRP